MRLLRIVTLLAALLSLTAQASVTPLNGPNSNVFLDAANGLLWSQPDAFAANNFATAEAAVSAATIEGLSDWYLPSLEQFRSLYRTQGTVSTDDTRPEYDRIMVESPFSRMLPTWYWTTNVFPDVNLQNYAFANRRKHAAASARRVLSEVVRRVQRESWPWLVQGVSRL